MTEAQNTKRPGALIAMSGGVDSSVAAWLMQQAGYDCTGITMRLTRNETLGQSGFHTCCSEKDIEDAAEVAFAMDIPYEVLDFTADFREKIIEKFIRVYEMGGTPNPCIDCNRYMKFDHLLRWAESHGMEYVVTGHYARVEQDEATGRWLLKKGLDEGKDQSYVLYNLTQEQLAHVRLPLGGCTRPKCVRSRKNSISSTPASTTARISALCRTAITPASWRTLPASITRQVIFWTRTAKRWAPTTVRCGIPSASARALALPWVRRCMSAPRICRLTPSQWGPEENLFDRIVYADEVNWIAIPELTVPFAGHGPHPLSPDRAGCHRLPGGRETVPAGI